MVITINSLNNNKMELEGKVVEIGSVVQKSDKYKQRSFVIEFNDGRYNQIAAMQLSQNRCDIADSFKVGDLVKVSFSIRGREWQGKYFSNLEAWKIEIIKGLSSDPANYPMNTSQEDDPFNFPKVTDDRYKDPQVLKALDEQLPF